MGPRLCILTNKETALLGFLLGILVVCKFLLNPFNDQDESTHARWGAVWLVQVTRLWAQYAMKHASRTDGV